MPTPEKINIYQVCRERELRLESKSDDKKYYIFVCIPTSCCAVNPSPKLDQTSLLTRTIRYVRNRSSRRAKRLLLLLLLLLSLFLAKNWWRRDRKEAALHRQELSVLPHAPSVCYGKGKKDRGRGGGGGLLIVMHGRSRMTVDSRILTMSGRRDRVGFSPTGEALHCLHQAKEAPVRCWASRMQGEPHPTWSR